MKTPAKKPLVVKCPKCGKRVEWAKNEFRPFCSERCQTSDKAAWASDEYSLPDSSNTSPPEEDSN